MVLWFGKRRCIGNGSLEMPRIKQHGWSRQSLPLRIVEVAAVAALIAIPSEQGFGLTHGCSTPLATFGATGSIASYTVPAGTTSIAIDAGGAQGGSGNGNRFGGFGAEVAATVTVTPGDILCIVVGTRGGNGSSGAVTGGGGGGSFVYRITSGACSDASPTTPVAIGTGNTAPNLLVAAGGGGGGGSTGSNPIDGGGPGLATGLGAGAAGATNGGTADGGGTGGTGGNGGGAGSIGGGGGGLLTDGGTGTSGCVGGESLRHGAAGSGSCASNNIGAGGYGGGGGGGGGGYNGGGGTNGNTNGGGGGGSYSIVTPDFATDGQFATGSGPTDGAVTLCPYVPVPTLSARSQFLLLTGLLLSGLILLRRRRA